MTPLRRWLVCILIACASALTAACDEGGIGMGVPTSTSGARWGGGSGGGSSGPGVFVGGGPVYR
jgi:hypothetical protein